MTEPKTYLSYSGGKWRVIHLGLPLCADQLSREEAMKAISRYRDAPGLKLDATAAVWNGDRGEWVQPDTIDEGDHGRD